MLEEFRFCRKAPLNCENCFKSIKVIYCEKVFVTRIGCLSKFDLKKQRSRQLFAYPKIEQRCFRLGKWFFTENSMIIWRLLVLRINTHTNGHLAEIFDRYLFNQTKSPMQSEEWDTTEKNLKFVDDHRGNKLFDHFLNYQQKTLTLLRKGVEVKILMQEFSLLWFILCWLTIRKTRSNRNLKASSS